MRRNPTLTNRTGIWALLLPLAGNSFFGTGFESFWLGDRLQSIWNALGAGFNEAHNGYLEVYLNLGWMGLILLGVVIVTGYRNAYNAFCRDPDAGRLRLAYFLAAVVYSFTEAGFRMMNPVWIFFLWATMAVPQLRTVLPQVRLVKVRRVLHQAHSPLPDDEPATVTIRTNENEG